MQCPHCEATLEERDGLYRSTGCAFVIDKAGFENILKHRGHPELAHERMFWQNLHEDKCPRDNEPLKRGEKDRAHMLDCSNPDCPFTIRRERKEEILANPRHSANRFKRKEREHRY